jgi:hypothetical protein
VRLVHPSHAGIQRAEAETAVGHERAHAESFGQGEGLPIIGFGGRARRRLILYCNVAEEAQGIGLVTTFLVPTGQCQRPLGMTRGQEGTGLYRRQGGLTKTLMAAGTREERHRLLTVS